MVNKLYPPIISGTLPAFVGQEITIPFQMNRAVSMAEVSGLCYIIKTVYSKEGEDDFVVMGNEKLTEEQQEKLNELQNIIKLEENNDVKTVMVVKFYCSEHVYQYNKVDWDMSHNE